MRTADLADYLAAGLCDPDVTDRDDRFRLLDWLAEQGFTIPEMRAALAANALGGLAGDRRLVPGERLGLAAAIARSDLDPDSFSVLSRALGFEPIHGGPDGEIGYTEDEIDLLAAISAMTSMFSRDESVAVLRVIGSALSRIADASVSLFLADVESPNRHARSGELGLARSAHEAIGLLDGFAGRLDPLLRRLTLQAVERSRRSTLDELDRLQFRYAVGFVDLVGFTSLSSTMAAPELARFLGHFESLSIDVVGEAGARVVKLIGDEVMFVATDPSVACRAGQLLLAALATEDRAVVPRGGIAYGEVVVRGGDYHGPVVNLASRLVDLAVPMQMLVTGEVADAASGFGFESAGRRTVKGFDAPIRVYTLGSG